jgi:hypothetical protein
MTNTGLQNTTQTTKNWATLTPQKTGVNAKVNMITVIISLSMYKVCRYQRGNQKA